MNAPELNEIDLVLLRTGVLRDHVLYTVAGTPGASRAHVLRAHRLLVRVGTPDHPELTDLCEWLLTEKGARAYAEHPEGRTWT